MTRDAPDAGPEPHAMPGRRRRGVPGRVVLLVSLVVLGLGVPLATWGLYVYAVSRATPAEPLVWRDRDAWRVYPAIKTALLKSGFLTPPESGVYRDTDFQPSADEAQRFRTAMDGLLTPDAAPPADPGVWYEHWAVGVRLRQTGDAGAEDALGRAFATAPKALRLRVVDPDGDPVPGLTLGTLIVVNAQATDHRLDASLRTVLPDATTDAAGCVYLPVFDTPVVLETRPQPAGWSLTWPIDEAYRWPGRAGSLPDIVAAPVTP